MTETQRENFLLLQDLIYDYNNIKTKFSYNALQADELPHNNTFRIDTFKIDRFILDEIKRITCKILKKHCL